MSVPPHGGWQPGPVPPNQGQPYGQPYDPSAYSQQQPPPPGWQQGSWPQHPAPPPKGSGLKWLLIAVAVLLVVAVSIGATLLFTRDSGGGGSTPTSSAPSDIASANDTGPVSIITSEPTCEALTGINRVLADVQNNGWAEERGTLGPASEWTSEQRTRVAAVATSIRNAADQMVSLAKRTPHRVMRELYEQFIAYGRAYADSTANYKAADNALAGTNVSLGNTLQGICNAVDSGSANRGLAIEPVEGPTQLSAPSDPANPNKFITAPGGVCDEWAANNDRFLAGTNEWEKLDANIAAAQWTPEQRSVQLSALPAFTELANEMEASGRGSSDPVFEDIALLGAVYLRAYVAAGTNYAIADSWLSYTALRLNNAVAAACRIVAG